MTGRIQHVTAGKDPYAAFRNFLRRRLPDAETAEDVLQQNLLKALEDGTWSEKENPSAWFHRVLRNAVADFYRSRAARERREASFAATELDSEVCPEESSEDACTCFRNLISELKPEYGKLLQAVDLEGEAPATVAAEAGITYNSLMVRLHRARRALREKLRENCGICSEHGCLNCSCRTPAHVPTP